MNSRVHRAIGALVAIGLAVISVRCTSGAPQADEPMLPDTPYNYTTVVVPDYIDRREINALDNTPDDNPLTNHGATLGRALFYDRRLSKNNAVACASCHLQEAGFADPRRFTGGKWRLARSARGKR